MLMATCASAAGGSILRGDSSGAAVAKRSVLVCKKLVLFVLRWLCTQLNRALNYYLRSLQNLKHTYHLCIRFGGGYLVAKVAKNRRNASVFASKFFRKRNQTLGDS
jgi:hypothetical protein